MLLSTDRKLLFSVSLQVGGSLSKFFHLATSYSNVSSDLQTEVKERPAEHMAENKEYRYALSYCAHCSALQLQYYDLIIRSRASIINRRLQAEFGSRSGFRLRLRKRTYTYQNLSTKNHQHSLHGHLRHHIKCWKVRIGKVVFVLAHFDGIQPLIHSAEGGEVWDAAVQEREMNTEGGHKQELLSITIQNGRSNIIVQTTCIWFWKWLIILHFQNTIWKLEDPTGLIHEPIFSKLIPHKGKKVFSKWSDRLQGANVSTQCLWKIWPMVLHSTTNESTDRDNGNQQTLALRGKLTPKAKMLENVLFWKLHNSFNPGFAWSIRGKDWIYQTKRL